jgi:hypothetical protein
MEWSGIFPGSVHEFVEESAECEKRSHPPPGVICLVPGISMATRH